MFLSSVEKKFLERSKKELRYEEENIPVVETENCFELGKLVALKFIEWVIKNPSGVISLSTGKTPEHFIKFLKQFKSTWNSAKMQTTLRDHGITQNAFPDCSNLKFVQMDEFFPLHHSNSFVGYIKKYYLPTLEIKPENLLLMDVLGENYSIFPNGIADLTLLNREPKGEQEVMQKKVLLKAESFCKAYEEEIKALGGIGFFLGGIGPDGHIAFNMHGSSPDSETRLVKLNYPSAAAAAGDFGGIELSRDRVAMTVGLKTISVNTDATIIIMAAGEAKSDVVAKSIEGDGMPSAVLHGHDGARFYLTKGAASDLHGRREEECIGAPDLIKKINTGLEERKGLTILHTAPHHDDIMLSYHPLAVSLLENNRNYFAYLTSGFTAVTNKYIKALVNDCKEVEKSRDYALLLKEFKKSFYAKDEFQKRRVEVQIFLKKVAEVFNNKELKKHLLWLKDYFCRMSPGQKDEEVVQRLKGAMRESEVDRLWAIHGVPDKNVFHLRSKFYTGDYFTKQASERDVTSMIELIDKVNPDIITVAFDPEGTGPDTHCKVLQLIAESVRRSGRRDLVIWGYRNIWHRFKPSETNFISPVPKEGLLFLDEVFLSCFTTQREASFPTPKFDGPFSGLSCEIQQKQMESIKSILGEQFFAEHTDARLRDAVGMLFLRQMTTAEFLANVLKLSSRMGFPQLL